MNKKIIIILSIIILALLTYFMLSNSDESKNKNVNTTKSIESPKINLSNYNISIFLDLSDRIDTTKYPNSTMQFYKRDLGYINSIASAFKEHVVHKKIRTIDDRIQIFFDPAPDNPKINSMIKQLKIKLDKKNVTKEKIKEIEKKYSNIPFKIYQLSLSDGNYIGSDIWGFFKSKVKDYCIKDKYRNILVILTDGYIYHVNNKFMEGNKSSYIITSGINKFNLNTSDWKNKIKQNKYGFIKANNDLDNLEVLVLGINPSEKYNNPYEFDILKTYWSNWFIEMGIKKFEIKQTDLPSNLDEFIQSFILKN